MAASLVRTLVVLSAGLLRPPRAPVPALLAGSPAASLQPALGFKTKGVLRRRCRDCCLVKRRGRWFVLCKSNPRHKQRQM